MTTRGAEARRRSTTRSSSATTRRSARSRTTSSRTSAQPLVDVRSPGEYSGELLHMPDYPQEGALRGGHIPGAASVPWARAAADDATFKTPRRAGGDLPGGAGPRARPTTSSPTAASASGRATPGSCSRTCSASTHVRNYDGCWTEWGNAVRVPIVQGSERPGPAVRRVGPRGSGRPPLPARSPRSSTSSPRSGRATGCSCCWSFARSCPRCPTATPTRPSRWSRCRSASRRCSWRWRWSPTPTGGCTCSSRRRPRRPPPAGSPSILRAGLDGEPAAEVLAVPDDFYVALGLAQAV